MGNVCYSRIKLFGLKYLKLLLKEGEFCKYIMEYETLWMIVE